MKLRRFSTYKRYIEAQWRTDARKPAKLTWAQREQVTAMARWLRNYDCPVSFGLCHGVRHGDEIDWFQAEFPAAEIVGTDLFPKNHPKTIKWDFAHPKPEWQGKCDFVYSNALDHAQHPQTCLRVWLDQLKPDGVLFVQWTPLHGPGGVRGGDCFGAHFHEYIQMLCKAGRVIDVLYHQTANPVTLTIATTHGEE